jgi:predicted GNAT family acetyltransferase
VPIEDAHAISHDGARTDDADQPTDVPHDATTERLVIAEDGGEAELVYRKPPGQLILIHTRVPDGLAGRGVGARLVRAAIALARAEHLTIVPWCPFARRWLADHPGEAESVAVDWDLLPPSRGPRRGPRARP